MTIWYVYILRCADRTYYTGITTDLARRLNEHNTQAKRAAKYTWARRPSVLVYSESLESRSAAAQREFAIKQFPRRLKDLLIQSWSE